MADKWVRKNPVNIKLFGDKGRAESFIGEGNRLLYQLHTRMNIWGSDQDSMYRILPDGTFVEVKSFGIQDIMIVKSPPVGKQVVVPKFEAKYPVGKIWKGSSVLPPTPENPKITPVYPEVKIPPKEEQIIETEIIKKPLLIFSINTKGLGLVLEPTGHNFKKVWGDYAYWPFASHGNDKYFFLNYRIYKKSDGTLVRYIYPIGLSSIVDITSDSTGVYYTGMDMNWYWGIVKIDKDNGQVLWSINRPVDYYGWWDAYEGRGWIVADGKRIYTVGYTQTEANKWLYKLLFECRSLDGVLLWSWEDLVGDFDQGCNGITIEQNTIYITYSNNIIAKINIETGSLMWAISYSDFHIGGIYVSGNSLYAHGADLLHSSYKIMRLDKNDGSIKWEKVYGTAIAGGIEVPAGAIGVVDNFIYSNSSILSAIGGEFPNYLFTVSTKGDQLNKVDIGRTFLSDKLPIDEGVGVWTMSLAWPTPTGELLGKSMTTKTVKEEVL